MSGLAETAKDPETQYPSDSEAQAIELTGSMDQPEGGLRGWMTVMGSWLILFSTLGYVYSFGVYEDYYTRTFLRGNSPSKIAWMGSLQLALPFAMGPLAGRLFDVGYARPAIASGALLYIFSLFMLSLAEEGQYYQVFLSQGLGMGLGAGLLFTPSTAIVSVHFRRRRSLAYGSALTGMSLGAVAFPILLNQLIPKIGFGNSVRVTGYIALCALVIGIILIRPPPKIPKTERSTDIASFFHDGVYLWFLFMAVITLLSIYFPTVYLQLYAVDHDIDETIAFYSLAILNGVSIIGRVVGCWLADRYGVWNMTIPTILGSMATVWGMLGIHDTASLVVITCLYGLFSGAWLAIAIAGLVSLARTQNEVGARVGIANAFMSIGCLASAPVQGALLSTEFKWVRPVAFAGTLLIFSTISCSTIRMLVSKRKNSQWI